jgi:UDP-glucose 4-epimerase
MGAIMVTGGLGYIGRYVVSQLRAGGRDVVSLNRDFSSADAPGLWHVQSELFDIPRIVRTVERFGVERVIHTAAMSHPELSLEIPITTVHANVDGTLHLLEALRMTAVRRVVNFSSECAYGERPEERVSEECPLEPTTPYGVTKAAVEMLARVYERAHGFDITSLRVTEVYGPGNRMPQYLCEMLDAALAGTPYRLERGGEHAFQFVHVADVARAAVLAAERERLPRRAYNVTGGTQITLAEASCLVRRAVPGAELDVGPGFIETLDRQGRYDIGAAERDLGYRPEWTLERGIADYVESRGAVAGVA